MPRFGGVFLLAHYAQALTFPRVGATLVFMEHRRIYGSRAAVEAACNAKRKKADAWAYWVKRTIVELEAAGFTSNGAIARELNQRDLRPSISSRFG